MKLYEKMTATEFADTVVDRLNTLRLQYQALVLHNVKNDDMNTAKYNLGVHDAAKGLMEFIEKEVPNDQ